MTFSDRPKILGVNVRHYPAQASVVGKPPITMIPGMEESFGTGDTIDQTDDPPPTLAVLVEGDIGDYACYVGHGAPQWVAQFGDKISFDEACCHFPGGQLDREKYRER